MLHVKKPTVEFPYPAEALSLRNVDVLKSILKDYRYALYCDDDTTLKYARYCGEREWDWMSLMRCLSLDDFVRLDYEAYIKSMDEVEDGISAEI